MNKKKSKQAFVLFLVLLFVFVSIANANIFEQVKKYKSKPVICPNVIKALDESVEKSLSQDENSSTVNIWGEEVELEINPIRIDDGSRTMARAMSMAIEPNQFDPSEVVIIERGFVTESVEWFANKIYFVNSPVVFSGEGVKWIPHPGAIILFDYGGCLIFRDGAIPVTGRYGSSGFADPNALRGNNPVDPVWMFPQNYQLGFIDFRNAIIIEETAGEGGVLSNLVIQGCFEGIVLRKNVPIMNNSFFSVMRPVVGYGQKDFMIVNCVFDYYGSFNDGPGNPWAAIDIYTEPSDPNLISGQCNIMIAGNTMNDGGCGVKIHGHWCKNCEKYLDNPLGPGDPNNSNLPILNLDYHDPNTVSPNIYCVNNITTVQHYTAYGFYDGIVTPVILNPGFGAIFEQTCNIPVPLEDEAWVWENPYEYDGGYRGHFLAEGCGFKGKGFGNIWDLPWLLGTTTSLSFEPDDCTLDLGVHYHHSVSNSVKHFDKTDLNQDSWINMRDFASFSSAWGKITWVEEFIGDPNDFYIDPNSIAYKSDFNEDGVVDIGDLVVFSDLFLVREMQESPQYELSFDQDLSSVSGVLNMTLTGNTMNASEIFLKIGTELVGRFSPDEEILGTYNFGFDTPKFGNGFHQIQIVSIEEPNSVVIMPPVHANFDNAFHDVTIDLENSYVSGFCDSENGKLEAKDWQQEYFQQDYEVWDPDLPFGGFVIEIPENLTSMGSAASFRFYDEEEQVEQLVFAVLGALGGVSSSEPLSKQWIKEVSKRIEIPALNDPNIVPFRRYKAALILPYENIARARPDSIKEFLKTMNVKNKPVLVLWKQNANYTNVGRILGIVRYADIKTHANYRWGGPNGPQISFWKLHDGSAAWWSRDYDSVFWRLGRNTPNNPDDDDIPTASIDENGLSAWDWQNYRYGNLKIVFFDGCYSARTAQIAASLGTFSAWSINHHDQIFIGYNDSGRIYGEGYDAVAARFWKEMRTQSAWHSYFVARTCPEASAYGGVSLNLQMIMPEPSTYSRMITIEKGN